MSDDIYLNTVPQKKILATLEPGLDLTLISSNVKLYTSNKEGKNWLYSDLEGLLCFILDYNLKTKYLVLYNSFSFEKIFQYELYKDFQKYFKSLAPEFRCFEVDSGFIGLQFDKKSEAEKADFIISKFKDSFTDELFTSRPLVKNEKNKERMKEITGDPNNPEDEGYYGILKRKFQVGKKYSEDYIESKIEINKARNFELLKTFSYNAEKKQFEIGEIKEELKDLFIDSGIRKKDLQDINYAFPIIKQIILGMSHNSKINNSTVANIQHKFPPPEERERIRKEEEELEKKMNKDRLKKKNKQSNVPQKQYTYMNPHPNQIPEIPVVNQINPQPIIQQPPVQQPPIIPQPPSLNPQLNPINPPTSQNQNPQMNTTSNIPKAPNIPIAPPIPTNPIKTNGDNKVNIPLPPPLTNNNTVVNNNNIPIPPPLTNNNTNVNNNNIPIPPPLTNNNTVVSNSNIPIPPPLSNIPIPPPLNNNTVGSGKIPVPPPLTNNTVSKPPVVPVAPVKNNTNNTGKKELSMHEQIKAVQLKKVEKQNTDQGNKLITGNERNYLQNVLVDAIKMRRANLHAYDDSDSDNDDDDDDDDDW